MTGNASYSIFIVQMQEISGGNLPGGFSVARRGDYGKINYVQLVRLADYD